MQKVEGSAVGWADKLPVLDKQARQSNKRLRFLSSPTHTYSPLDLLIQQKYEKEYAKFRGYRSIKTVVSCFEIYGG